MKIKTVSVKLADCDYDIEIGTGNLSRISSMVSDLSPSKVYLVFDENVECYCQDIQSALKQVGFNPLTLRIPAGERSKTIEQASLVWEFLTRHHADRQSLIVAIGGGVVGDLAGFIAATYARGLPFFQVPTTLLAHVDSSVGGKTGINLKAAKNMVGAFWQPSGVLIDTETLSTLEDREYISGLAEVIKYGVIMDADFFGLLERESIGLKNRDAELLVEVISHCCQLKALVVHEDEKETTGRRAILNYGHTFAHAFETVLGYGKYLHGEAVAVGMTCAAHLAEELQLVPLDFRQRQTDLLQAVGLPVVVEPTELEPLVDVMRRDKKNLGDQIRFILPTKMGHARLFDDVLPDSVIHSALQQVMQ